MKQSEFARGVLGRYERLSESAVAKTASGQFVSHSVASLPTAPPVGHPEFAALPVGGVASCDMAIAFIDMRAMTARSFWQPVEEVTRLSLAVLGQVAAVIQESGGHVLGLRGDGLMAGWGCSTSDARVDVYMAMAAAGFCLDAVRGAVNDLLALDGIAPVQICAGADWGEVAFARTGTTEASEVNIVGHPANFAAKCENTANSWEVVVGQGLSGHVGEQSLLTAHPSSPKMYEHQGERLSYRYYKFDWAEVLRESASAIAQVGGRHTGLVTLSFKEDQ